YGVPVRDFREWATTSAAQVMPYRLMTTTAEHQRPKLATQHNLVRGEGLEGERLMNSFVLSAGRVRSFEIIDAALWTSESVALQRNTLAGSVLICDGDCTVSHASRTIIVANGNVRSSLILANCRIAATGTVTLPSGPEKYIQGTLIQQNQ